MWIQQVSVAWLCILLALQRITAVVNNGQKVNELLIVNTTTNTTSGDNSLKNNNTSVALDSFAESTDIIRREAALALTYGAPLPNNAVGTIHNSYLPLIPSNINLPTPEYGVPNSPTNNIIYPAPPPDIPPPIQNIPNFYSKNLRGSSSIFYSPLKYGPPPQNSYKPSFNSLKPGYGPPPIFRGPKPQYGVPSKTLFNPSKIQKPTYGLPIKLPKLHYGPPKPIYNPSKPLHVYGPPNGNYNGHKNIYGPPKPVYAPSIGAYEPSPAIQYGPSEAVPHGPPHPGVAAPPTPPDIKYDGWQPIPGLVSRPLSGSYGVPQGQPLGINDLQFNTDFVPPPGGHNHPSEVNEPQRIVPTPNDSYGAPLNTITGSGGVVTTSGDTLHGNGDVHHGTANTQGGPELSVIKSVAYEIVPNTSGDFSAHAYNTNELSTISTFNNFASSIAASYDSTLLGGSIGLGHDLSANVGLIPPSGVYGVPPSGNLGTHVNNYNLNFNQPRTPVVFREPVPSGFIESIGQSVAQKDAHGIIESAHSNSYNGPSYVPPPVPDVSNVKPVNEVEPIAPSNFYSLPNKNAVSFQNIVHGSSTAGLNTDYASSTNVVDYPAAAALTSYTAPLGTIDSSYGLPQITNGLSVGLANENSAASLDNAHAYTSNNYAFTNSQSTPYFAHYQNIGHDCSYRSHPVPTLSFGVPAANSYTASLSSLNTNIAGAHQSVSPSLSYNAPDQQTAHSTSSNSLSEASINSVSSKENEEAEVIEKSLTSNSENELIKSQALDLNHIPLQGTLGSYTLQIQSADGIEGGSNIPHNQVLNDGLLQSILNAIEQPQQDNAGNIRQPFIQLQQLPTQESVDFRSSSFNQTDSPDTDNSVDSEGENSLSKTVVVTPEALQTTVIFNSDAQSEKGVTEQSVGDNSENLSSLNNNEIALYFSNKAQFLGTKDPINSEHESDHTDNDQIHGSYPSL